MEKKLKLSKTKLYDLYIRSYCFKTETISGIYVGSHRASSFEIAKKKQLTIMKKAAKKPGEDTPKIYANTYPFFESLEEAMSV